MKLLIVVVDVLVPGDHGLSGHFSACLMLETGGCCLLIVPRARNFGAVVKASMMVAMVV